MHSNDELFGTEVISLKAYCHRTLDLIAKTKDHNSGLACLIRVTRALSLRPTLDHLNPFRLYREDPIPHLAVRDKLAGPWVPERWLTLTASPLDLVKNGCNRWFGEMECLPYSWNRKVVPFHQLPAAEQRRLNDILKDGDKANVGRIALYNENWRHGVGEIIRQSQFAHGPLLAHPYAGLLPFSLKCILEISNASSKIICEKVGIDACAEQLTVLLDRVLEKEILERARKNPPKIRKTKTHERLGDVPEGIHRPLDYAEYQEYRAFFHRLQTFVFGGKGRKGAKKWRKHAAGVIGIISLLLGIPLKHLLNYRAYYSFDSFIIAEPSGEIYFLVVGGHHDAGGLYRYPVRVCSKEEAGTNPIMLVIGSLLAQQVVRRQRKATRETALKTAVTDPLFGSEILDPSKVGNGLRFAFAPNGRCPFHDQEIFDRANRFSEHKCVIHHPALVAANWCKRSFLGLNHYRIEDLISYSSLAPVQLLTLTGAPWVDRLAAEYVSSRNRRDVEIKIPGENADVSEWKEYLRDTSVSPSIRGFQDAIIMSAGINVNSARWLALQVFDIFREEGLLHCSTPLPLLSEVQANKLFEETRLHLETRFRAKTRGRNATMQGITIEDIREEMGGFFGLLDLSSMRPKEIWDLLAKNAIVVHKTGFIFVTHGKTPASKRTIELAASGRTSFDLSQHRNSRDLDQGQYWLPFLHAHYTSKSDKYSAIRNLANALSRNSSEMAITSYYLRHHGLISKIHEITSCKLAKGNFWAALSSLSISAGHGSLLVTLCTYLGTAVFVLERRRLMTLPRIETDPYEST